MENIKPPFWSLMSGLKQQLGYTISLDKYFDFVNLLNSSRLLKNPCNQPIDTPKLYSDPLSLFYIAKGLFLVNEKDHLGIFSELFYEVLVEELKKTETPIDKKVSNLTSKIISDHSNETSDPKKNVRESLNLPNAPLIKEIMDGKLDIDNDTKGNPISLSNEKNRISDNIKKLNEGNVAKNSSDNRKSFTFSDEYFNATRRQMIKAWRSIRSSESSRGWQDIDINETMNKIVQLGGFFIEPAYVRVKRNRKALLLIFADYMGSMIPFHELSDRLIRTATHEGGHDNANVYYFQNWPLGYLFRNSNLTDLISRKEVFSRAHKGSTIAIIISDAGRARQDPNTKSSSLRYEKMNSFLSELRPTVSRTIWINPLPRDRWKDNAAIELEKRVDLMIPILDKNQMHFQDSFLSIFKTVE